MENGDGRHGGAGGGGEGEGEQCHPSIAVVGVLCQARSSRRALDGPVVVDEETWTPSSSRKLISANDTAGTASC